MTKLNTVKKLVYHHTGTPDITIDDMIISMQRKRGRIPAHYIVGANGGFQKIGINEGLNVGATLNAETNMEAIQIETIGNFNNRRPTLNQYQTLRQLTQWIDEKYGTLEKTLHRDESATACPGKFFDTNMIKTGLIKFDISRYYLPVPLQKKYLSSIPGFYSEEYAKKYTDLGWKPGYEWEVCMNCGCNETELSKCIPSDQIKYVEKDVFYAVACPKELKLGTKIYIENYGVVKCKDRGGAIKYNKKTNTYRLDLFVGYGDEGLKNRNNIEVLHGPRNGFIVK